MDLLYCCCPEGVSRSQDHFFACSGEFVGQFAYGGGFANTVDANNHDYVWPGLFAVFLPEGRTIIFGEQGGYFFPQDIVQFCRIQITVAGNALFNAAYDLQGGGYSYVRGNRSYEHTSELQSLMRISYAVF